MLHASNIAILLRLTTVGMNFQNYPVAALLQLNDEQQQKDPDPLRMLPYKSSPFIY